uniref:uncharacterized protein LOC118549992 n=1 Tax=Halichoerus grypus TaxID=9711 RepID=UPI00165A04D5|nr:uncharacterized protein LOC118549992 [Halichoerus grypus]
MYWTMHRTMHWTMHRTMHWTTHWSRDKETEPQRSRKLPMFTDPVCMYQKGHRTYRVRSYLRFQATPRGVWNVSPQVFSSSLMAITTIYVFATPKFASPAGLFSELPNCASNHLDEITIKHVFLRASTSGVRISIEVYFFLICIETLHPLPTRLFLLNWA